MAALRTIPLAALLSALSACALAQGKAASTPTLPAPAVAPRVTPQTPAAPPARAETPAAPPARAETPAAPLVTPEGPRAPTPTPGNTPGQLVMTPQEQQQYRQDLARAKTGDECRAVVARQRALVTKRAYERGESPPNNPGSDPCAGR
ncbi:MAG TPA: hypothetical protein VFK10_07670 [Burkholderiaceae bacterium]|nr:hypothetical protein [Burkholderiaceae bacterium]